MRVITEAIEKLVSEYVHQRGLVLWFDPERHYESVARGLNAGQERILAFDGSFYKLRLTAEPFLRGFDAPKLLVYLPIAWEDAREPLAELLALGVDLRPGVSGSRNTRLAVVARKALKGRVADSRLADLDRQIEQGGLTLAELEELVAEDGAYSLPTALAVHFETALVGEAALDFLARPERDAELVARNGLADWAYALGALYGISVEVGASPVVAQAARPAIVNVRIDGIARRGGARGFAARGLGGGVNGGEARGGTGERVAEQAGLCCQLSGSLRRGGDVAAPRFD